MTVTEVLDGLGSWSITLRPDTPGWLYDRLAHFGHVAILTGQPNVELTGDGLLKAARYVGVLRKRARDDGRVIEGSGMVVWLGDEDEKGAVFENPVSLVNATLAQAVAAVLPASVQLGTIFPGATGTYTGKHQFESPRTALTTITQAFGREFRVNGDATVDIGTAAQLYRSTPNAIAVTKSAGSDFDMATIGTKFATDDSSIDYTTRVVLLGQTTDSGTIATGSADSPVNPYRDLFSNPVRRTRMISESGQTVGSVAARAQLQLNRFARVARALRVSSEGYETNGTFRVGDTVYVYDPEAGLLNTANEVYFNGQVLNPDTIRVTGLTWQVDKMYTVAYRDNSGVWIDLSPYVVFESGREDIKVGDLPRSLGTGGNNPVQDRIDAAPDTTIPTAPTNVALTSQSFLSPKGALGSYLTPTWDAPATNTDGSVFTDLAYYSIRYRATGRPTWEYVQTATRTYDIVVTPGISYEVDVAAVDKAGNAGVYSGTVTGVSSVDTFAPPAPADPIVSSFIGQLRIEYSGKASDGSAMPADTNRVDVHVSDTNNFTATDTTRVSSLNPFAKGVALTTAPYASARYVRLLAIDNAGNVSASSAIISGVAVQANDGDIAALNVGKLVTGTMTAEVAVAGRFATALTGARTEFNASGFYKYAADGTQLVAVDGTRALLTGIFMTAADGRRIQIGAAGNTGLIDFFAPDNKSGRIRGFTESTGLEALRLEGPRDAAITGIPGSFVNLNSDNFSSYRANVHEFQLQPGATMQKYRIVFSEGDGFFDTVFPNRGTIKMSSPNIANTDQSPWLSFTPPSPNAFSVVLRAAATSTYQYLDLVNSNSSGWYSHRASQFLTQSDGRAKSEPLNVSRSDMLDDLLSMRVRRYHRKHPDRPGDYRDREELGFISQEAPDRVVYTDDDLDTSFVDTYQLLALTVGALQGLHRDFDEYRKAHE